MKQSIDSYVVEFIKKWGDKLNPIIKDNLSKKSYIDVTEDFKTKKGCHLTYNGILEGQKIYALIFKGCKSMAEKWELTSKGNVRKNFYGKPMVRVYSTSVALVPLDLIVEFISTDEILPINKNFSGPYGLGQKWIEKLMTKLKTNPGKDLIFFFVSPEGEIEKKVKRFLNELAYIVDGGYLKKKGFLNLDGPQWRKYIPSEELTETSKIFLSSAISGKFDKRISAKMRKVNP